MKKVIVGVILGSAVALAACSQDNAESADPAEDTAPAAEVEDQSEDTASENNAEEAEEQQSSRPGVGDTVEMDGLTVTLLSAELTDERADGASADQVLKFEYELENTSDEDLELKEIRLIDSTGSLLDPYPLENSTDLPGPGEKAKGVGHYVAGESPIEIWFIKSMDSVTLFEVDPEGMQ